MTRTFIDKETGEEFEEHHKVTQLCGVGTIFIVPKPKKPEPKLEVGDWYTELHNIYAYTVFPPLCKDNLLEIRKANGEVWKKANGEWVKL